MTGETVLVVVGYVNLATFAGFDGSLGECGDCATATGECLMDDQGRCAGIDK